MFDMNDMFNWDTTADNAALELKSEKKKYESDARFYVLPKNEKKEGVAVIRLLPDAEGKKFTAIQKISTTIQNGSQKRFVNEMSPATINQPCPFQEKWAELYNADRKEESKSFSRNIRYVVNIKIIKDPLKPENEGKIFLYEISGRLKDKFQAALEPSESDVAVGTKPKQLFNPIKGNSIKLVAKMGANGQINYDSTEIMPEETAIYSSPEEAINDIKANAFLVSKELLAPDKFKSYDELKKDLAWVTFADTEKSAVAAVQSTQAATVVTTGIADVADVTPSAQVTSTQSSSSSDLDSLLDGII